MEIDESTKVDRRSEAELGRALLRLRQAPRQLLIGVLLMLVSGLMGAVVIRGESPNTPALRLLRDVPAGVSLTTQDFEEVLLPDRLAGDWLRVSDLSEGATASRPLRVGELAYKSDLRGLPDGRPSLAVAVATSQLPAGIGVGDGVELWSSSPDLPEQLTANATLRAMSQDEASHLWSLTLAVESGALPRILAAIAGDGLTLVALPR